jgi:outer membrane protein TolC
MVAASLRSWKVKCKYLVPAVLLSCAAGFGQPDRPAAAPNLLTVDQAVAEALEANPEIRAAGRRVTLAQTKTSTAGSLDDPMFTVRDWQTPLRKPWDLNQAQLMFMVERTFPSMEKRMVRSRVAIENAQAAAEDLDTVRQEVTAEVRKTCADLKRSRCTTARLPC